MPEFFVSYNKADRDWALWIAWVLEEAKYSVILQDWDFRPGNNFVLAMQNALERSPSVLAVLSPSYLKALYTQAEWANAFARDPTGSKGLLIPVRVRKCDPRGLLQSVVHIDLVGLKEKEAKRALLDGLKDRAKPSEPPVFPQDEEVAAERQVPAKPLFPGVRSYLAVLTFLVLVLGGIGGLALFFRDPVASPVITRTEAFREGQEVKLQVYFTVREVPEEGSVSLQVGEEQDLDPLWCNELPISHWEQGSALWACDRIPGESQGYVRIVVRRENGSDAAASRVEKFRIEDSKP